MRDRDEAAGDGRDLRRRRRRGRPLTPTLSNLRSSPAWLTTWLTWLTLLTGPTSLALVGGGGCAIRTVPYAMRRTREQAVMSVKGSPTRITFRNQGIALGELVAVSDDTVSILTDEGALVPYSVAQIQSVALGVHDNDAGQFAIWTALGAVSTISHGRFLLFTLPLWLAVGLGVTMQESMSGSVESPPAPLVSLKAYARFPQGAPPGITAASLTGAPPRVPPSPSAPPPAPVYAPPPPPSSSPPAEAPFRRPPSFPGPDSPPQ